MMIYSYFNGFLNSTELRPLLTLNQFAWAQAFTGVILKLLQLSMRTTIFT